MNNPIPESREVPRDIPWYPVAVVLAVLVLSAYWRVGEYSFVNVDDGLYVNENPVVLRGLTLDGIEWAFSSFYAANWHPLTWLSHMLDVELFGTSAGWHHRMNVLYHLLNTELLFLVLWRMTGGFWQCAFVAAMFGVHPLHVESVAWIAERKDVLSAFFWILAMGAYRWYTLRPNIARYLLVAGAFALGLMCKPMVVTLPFVLLLLDYWPLGRMAPVHAAHAPSREVVGPAWSRLVLEKVPLLILSAISSVVTYLAQTGGGTIPPEEVLPVVTRFSNAVTSYAVYLGKMLWPSALAVIYPLPAIVHESIPAWKISISIILLALLSGTTLRMRHRRPYLLVGWLWYLGTLVPVIGMIQVGPQACADRYTYIPLIGVFIAIAWGLAPTVSVRRFRRVAIGVIAGGLLVVFSIATSIQVGHWRDSETLLTRAVAVTDNNWFALKVLGNHYAGIGQHDNAISCYLRALRIHPSQADTWNNLGIPYSALGQLDKAIPCYHEAVRLMPDFAEAWCNLGASYGRLGRNREAIGYYREALRIQRNNADAWFNLGVLFAGLDEHEQAVSCYREALLVNPHHSEAQAGLAESHGKLRRDGTPPPSK